jgi:hypothetical protein
MCVSAFRHGAAGEILKKQGGGAGIALPAVPRSNFPN